MYTFTPQNFSIPELVGIGKETIEEHLKLYIGYVTFANQILERIETLQKENGPTYEIAELQRRFSFEFDGMRNHEYYFRALSGGHTLIDTTSDLYKKITNTWGSFDVWLANFHALALTRGIGWAILYYDKQTDQLLHAWIDEQHLGQLSSCTPILALDMWEHSYVLDYRPSGKKQYVLDFFRNINWKEIETHFTETVKSVPLSNQ